MAKYDNSIDNMQAKLKRIRKMFGISVTKFSIMLGVTRQTVYNIESGKTKMTKVQFLAMQTIITELLGAFPERKKELDLIWEENYGSEGLKKIQIKYL